MSVDHRFRAAPWAHPNPGIQKYLGSGLIKGIGPVMAGA